MEYDSGSKHLVEVSPEQAEVAHTHEAQGGNPLDVLPDLSEEAYGKVVTTEFVYQDGVVESEGSRKQREERNKAVEEREREKEKEERAKEEKEKEKERLPQGHHRGPKVTVIRRAVAINRHLEDGYYAYADDRVPFLGGYLSYMATDSSSSQREESPDEFLEHLQEECHVL